MEELIKNLKSWSYLDEEDKVVLLDIAEWFIKRAYNAGFEDCQKSLLKVVEKLN